MLEQYTYMPKIISCITQRIDFMIDRHCKVFFVRFDVRFPAGTVHKGPNIEISRLVKDLTSYYTDHDIATHYIWVREQWSSDAPHYHVLLLLNGSRVQSPMGVWTKAAEIWSRITDGPSALIQQCRQGTMGLTGNGGIMIRRPSSIAVGHDLLVQQQKFQTAYGAALEWGSYLAKDFSKGYAPHRVREYGSSLLRPELPQLPRMWAPSALIPGKTVGSMAYGVD